MKILTINVRDWFRDTKKSDPNYWKTRAWKMSEFISKEGPDIILFQEMLFPMTGYIPREYKKATGASISHHIYCRNSYKVVSHEWHTHWCRAAINPRNKRFSLDSLINFFSVHSHWDLEKHIKTCEALENNLLPFRNIAGGDWNNDPYLTMRLFAVRDLLRVAAPAEETFQNWTKLESHGCIDYFATSNIADGINVYVPKVETISDHRPVILEV